MRITSPDFSLPAFPVKGRCGCGAVHYRLMQKPLCLLQCHCLDCQHLTGSAYSLAMPVADDAIVIDKGTVREWTRTGGSGAKIAQYVCDVCGTRLYTKPPGAGIKTLRAGTLDDTSWLVPVGAIWLADAQPPYRRGTHPFADDLLLYDHNPEDFGPLLAAWQNAIA